MNNLEPKKRFTLLLKLHLRSAWVFSFCEPQQFRDTDSERDRDRMTHSRTTVNETVFFLLLFLAFVTEQKLQKNEYTIAQKIDDGKSRHADADLKYV